VGSLAVVVIDVLLKNQLQVALAKDKHPVQSFVAQCLDHPLAMGVRSWAPVGREGLWDGKSGSSSCRPRIDVMKSA